MPGPNKRFTLLKNPPTKMDGKEGEVTIREEKGELKLYVKYKNKWHGVKIGSAFDKLENNVEKISKLPFVLDKTRFGKKQFGTLWNAIDWINKTKSDNLILGHGNTAGEVKLVNTAGTLGIQSSSDTSKQITFDGTNTKIVQDNNNGNPTLQIGSSDNENIKITANYDSGGKGIDAIQYITNTAGSTASGDGYKGRHEFYIDGTGGVNLRLTINEDTIKISSANLLISTTQKLYLDGGNDTYIHESGGDIIQMVVGDAVILQLSEKGASGNEILIGGSAGFTTGTTSYHASEINVDFRTTNKQFIELTGDVASGDDLFLLFPSMSGHFTLVVRQDGTGGHEIHSDAWAAKDAAGNLINNGGTDAGEISWPGGTAPELSGILNRTDIFTFFWDATTAEEKCYGMFSGNFF